MEDERGSRVRARKRSLPGTAARKIASCVDCSKRFITFSGSDVCIDCRRINGRVSPGPPKNDPVNNASATVRRRLGQISSKDDSSSIRKENRENKLADTTCSRLPSSESAIFGSANAPSDDCHGSSIDSGLQPIMPIHKGQKESEEEVATIDQILLNEKLSQKTLPVSKVASDINDVEVLDIVTEHGCDRRDRRGNSDSNSGNNDGQGSRSHETDVQLIDDSSDKDNKTDRREVSICADKSLQSDSIINNLANSSHVRKSQHASSSLFFATSSQGVGDASYRCFICNTPLSAVQGLKGRLNHIKRCGKKHGIQAGDGAKGLNGDQMGGALIGNGKCAETINYDRHGWHDDKDAGMAIDDVVDTTEPRQPSRADDYDKKVHSKDDNASTIGQQKQSNLTSFFSRPVRSLDKVLLQGARNEAKKEQIACKRQQLPASNAQSSARGRGGGSWKKRKREPPVSICNPTFFFSLSIFEQPIVHYFNSSISCVSYCIVRIQRYLAHNTKESPTRQCLSTLFITQIQRYRRRISFHTFILTTTVELRRTGAGVSSTAPLRLHHLSIPSSVLPRSTFILCQCIQRLSSTPTAVPFPLHYSMLIIVPVPSCFYLSYQMERKSCT